MPDLSVEQVRNELMDIISRYPDRTGGEVSDYGNKDCVYFKDEDGVGISYSEFGDGYFEPIPEMLVTPVCIVGQWVQDFHPELKEDADFQYVLFRNSILSTSKEAVKVLGEDVHNLLSVAQIQQDDNNDFTWKQINLNKRLTDFM